MDMRPNHVEQLIEIRDRYRELAKLAKARAIAFQEQGSTVFATVWNDAANGYQEEADRLTHKYRLEE